MDTCCDLPGVVSGTAIFSQLFFFFFILVPVGTPYDDSLKCYICAVCEVFVLKQHISPLGAHTSPVNLKPLLTVSQRDEESCPAPPYACTCSSNVQGAPGPPGPIVCLYMPFFFYFSVIFCATIRHISKDY